MPMGRDVGLAIRLNYVSESGPILDRASFLNLEWSNIRQSILCLNQEWSNIRHNIFLSSTDLRQMRFWWYSHASLEKHFHCKNVRQYAWVHSSHKKLYRASHFSLSHDTRSKPNFSHIDQHFAGPSSAYLIRMSFVWDNNMAVPCTSVYAGHAKGPSDTWSKNLSTQLTLSLALSIYRVF